MSNSLAMANLLEDLCGLADDEAVSQIMWEAKHKIEDHVNIQNEDLTNKEKQLILEGNSIDAIKSFRNRTSTTLMVAKEKVDKYKEKCCAI